MRRYVQTHALRCHMYIEITYCVAARVITESTICVNLRTRTPNIRIKFNARVLVVGIDVSVYEEYNLRIYPNNRYKFRIVQTFAILFNDANEIIHGAVYIRDTVLPLLSTVCARLHAINCVNRYFYITSRFKPNSLYNFVTIDIRSGAISVSWR